MPRPANSWSAQSAKRAAPKRTAPRTIDLSPPSCPNSAASDPDSDTSLWHDRRMPSTIYRCASHTLPKATASAVSATIISQYFVDYRDNLVDQALRNGGRPVFVVRVDWGCDKGVEDLHVDAMALKSYVSPAELQRWDDFQSKAQMDQYWAERKVEQRERVGRDKGGKTAAGSGSVTVIEKGLGAVSALQSANAVGSRGRPRGSRIINGKLVLPDLPMEGKLGDENVEDVEKEPQEEGGSADVVEQDASFDGSGEGSGGDGMDEDEQYELNVSKAAIFGAVEQCLQDQGSDDEEGGKEEFEDEEDKEEEFDDEQEESVEDQSSSSSRQAQRSRLASPLIEDRNRKGRLTSRAKTSSLEFIGPPISRRHLQNTVSGPEVNLKVTKQHFESTSTSTSSQSSATIKLRYKNVGKRQSQSRETSSKKRRLSTQSPTPEAPPEDQGTVDDDEEEEEEEQEGEEEEEIIEAESVIDLQIVRSQLQYLVKWSHPATEPSWHDVQDLESVRDLLEAFHQRVGITNEKLQKLRKMQRRGDLPLLRWSARNRG